MQNIARERVTELYRMATEVHAEDPALANRYIFHARKIAMAAKIGIPCEIRRYICRGCKHLLVPGRNMVTRIAHRKGYGSYVIQTCGDCGKQARYIFKGNAYSLKSTKKKRPAKNRNNQNNQNNRTNQNMRR